MRNVLVLTLIMVLALSAFAWAGSSKPVDINKVEVLQKTDSFILSNESCNYLLDKFAGQNISVYTAITRLRDSAYGTNNTYLKNQFDAMLTAINGNPSAKEVLMATTLTASMASHEKSLVINTDGTLLQNANITARVYYNGASSLTPPTLNVLQALNLDPNHYLDPNGNSTLSAKLEQVAALNTLPGNQLATAIQALGFSAGDLDVLLSACTGNSYSTVGCSIAGVGRGLFTYASNGDKINAGTGITNRTDTYGGGLINQHVTTQTSYEAFAIGWSSPIVLDLNGDGKLDASAGQWLPHAGMINGTKVAMFDLNCDGFKELVEWVGPNDGLLIMPDEKITEDMDGSKLFGNSDGYNDGYEKLSVYDINKDGILTEKELNGMKIWIDKNGNAIVEANEVKSLDSMKITEITVNHKDFVSSFVQNGKRKYSWDWWPSYMDVKKVATDK